MNPDTEVRCAGTVQCYTVYSCARSDLQSRIAIEY